jgi:ubiquinone/menaquinone biosynthesis C-methylase UbiE
MNSKIELLSANLLEDKNKLKEIDHWLNVLNWPNGWHYDLDIIWILKHIEEIKLKPGATIIDAGAGLGTTQFILASRGFNVISLDFTQRYAPKYSKGIFNVEIKDADLGNYKHEYMEWMTYGQKEKKAEHKPKKKFTQRIINALKDPARVAYYLNEEFKKRYNVYYNLEKNRDHSKFGKITFLRGTFNKIPLEECSADLLVSVSAFEHNTYEDMPGSVIEFARVLKPNSPMMVTTSATDQKDWYFKPSKGWNFSKETLANWFDVKDNIYFDYEKDFKEIKNSRVLRSRLSSFYKFSGENGLPYGNFEEIKYVPVGILKYKK